MLGAGEPSLVAAALVAYAAGFVVTLIWARALHRRHGLDDPRAALPAAFTGGALGGLCALLAATADIEPPWL